MIAGKPEIEEEALVRTTHESKDSNSNLRHRNNVLKSSEEHPDFEDVEMEPSVTAPIAKARRGRAEEEKEVSVITATIIAESGSREIVSLNRKLEAVLRAAAAGQERMEERIAEDIRKLRAR